MGRDGLRRMQKRFDMASVSSFVSVLNVHISILFFHQKIMTGIMKTPPTPMHNV